MVDETFRKLIPKSDSGAPSVSSYKSSVTGRSKTSGTRSRIGTDGKPGSADQTGQIIQLDDPDAEFGNFNTTDALFDFVQKAVSITDQ